MSEETRPQSPFEFHTGYTATQSGSQFIMDCPFCNGEEKFFFNELYQWDCKKGDCNKSGNAFTFIRLLYDMFDTKSRAAETLSKARGLPRDYFMQNGVKYNEINNTYIIPTYKHGKIYNLYKAVPRKEFDAALNVFIDKFMILATPGIEHMIMHWPETTHDTVWVVEGHWDKVAGDAIVGPSKEITVVAVPGAGVWKAGWCEILSGKDVVFIYDNDSRGKAGFERVILKEIAKSQHKPKSIKYMSWPEGVKDGYDLNDLFKHLGRKAFDYIQDNLKPYSAPEDAVVVKTTIETVAPDLSCDSFDKLNAIFKDMYHVTPDMELGLACLLASVYSIKIGGEQLWYKIIGPAGCGKTTLAKIISSSDQVVLKSTFTGLFSGWRDDSAEDASMIPMIANKTLVVKDADALLQQPNIAKIFSELRDFYDKDSSTQFKNRVSHDYRNIRSTMILCGTNVLRRADSSFLGERFLDYELHITKEDERAIKQKMLDKSFDLAFDESGLPPETPLLAAAKGFIDHHLMERKVTTRETPAVRKLIYELSSLVAQMRTAVDRDAMGKGEITFTPVVEVPSRLIGQLAKLAICLPVVTGNNDWVERAIRKIAVDIIDPTCRRFLVCQTLREGWFNRDQLIEATSMSRTTLTRELDDLRALNLIDIRAQRSNIHAGRSQYAFTLREEVKDGMRLLGH